jgi:acid stress-induced BolA-like protein IbaG/YrbA
MDAAAVKARIEAGLPGATALVQTADNTHFEALVVAPQFAGLRPLKRHQLVYGAVGHEVGREVHALSITAYTPEEATAAGVGT